MRATVSHSVSPTLLYIDATSIALLALRGHEHEAGVNTSLSWLGARLADCPSPYSLAWGILALTAYRKRVVETEDVLLRAADKLMVAIGKGASILDPPTLATCALALEAIEGNGVFEVRS